MKTKLSILRVGTALGAAAGLSFVICVAWDAVFPAWKMYPFWRSLLPGFEWISVGSFFLGLFESVLIGYWAAAVFVPAYNVLGRVTWLLRAEHTVRTRRPGAGSRRPQATSGLTAWGARHA